jgi:hypothetical protein
VQGILENACYNFGSREMKDIIEKRVGIAQNVSN